MLGRTIVRYLAEVDWQQKICSRVWLTGALTCCRFSADCSLLLTFRAECGRGLVRCLFRLLSQGLHMGRDFDGRWTSLGLFWRAAHSWRACGTCVWVMRGEQHSCAVRTRSVYLPRTFLLLEAMPLTAFAALILLYSKPGASVQPAREAQGNHRQR